MFCTHCGSRLSDSAKFCTKCGSPVIAISVPRPAPETSPARVQQTLPVQKEPVPARPYGQQTGVIPVPVQQASAAPARKSVSQQSPVQPVRGSGPSQNPSAPVSKTQPVPQVFRFAAPAFAGEAAVGSLGNPAAAISELTATPGQVLTDGFRSFFSSLAAIFKKAETADRTAGTFVRLAGARHSENKGRGFPARRNTVFSHVLVHNAGIPVPDLSRSARCFKNSHESVLPVLRMAVRFHLRIHPGIRLCD